MIQKKKARDCKFVGCTMHCTAPPDRSFAARPAPREIVNSPGVVGTPEMAPVAGLRVRPVGRPVAVKAVGVLVAVIV